MSKLVLLFIASTAAGTDWIRLFNGKDLSGWESVGDGVWSVMKDGVLLGDRRPKSVHQAWLYTKREFGDFDLSLEYWTKLGGNSGISIRDHTRARFAVMPDWDPKRTPSHNGYEIQIMNLPGPVKYPTGSIYLFAESTNVRQNTGDWNQLEIESRQERIRVRLNGVEVCEHAGDPAWPKSGPIGLQLHDGASVVMFRNIRLRER